MPALSSSLFFTHQSRICVCVSESLFVNYFLGSIVWKLHFHSLHEAIYTEPLCLLLLFIVNVIMINFFCFRKSFVLYCFRQLIICVVSFQRINHPYCFVLENQFYVLFCFRGLMICDYMYCIVPLHI